MVLAYYKLNFNDSVLVFFFPECRLKKYAFLFTIHLSLSIHLFLQ